VEIVASILGGILFIAIVLIVYHQLTHREFHGPGYLDEWDMMADYEPDTRTHAERLEEQRRLLEFELKRYQTGDKEG
jgi:hypothetical protein